MVVLLVSESFARSQAYRIEFGPRVVAIVKWVLEQEFLEVNFFQTHHRTECIANLLSSISAHIVTFTREGNVSYGCQLY